MGFGLHAGWAIEGAVGSLQKVDATYLSPHVNMAARLETSSRQYGVPLLASHFFHELMSAEGRDFCRKIDVCTVKGSEVPIGVYTYDALQEQTFCEQYVGTEKMRRGSISSVASGESGDSDHNEPSSRRGSHASQASDGTPPQGSPAPSDIGVRKSSFGGALAVAGAVAEVAASAGGGTGSQRKTSRASTPPGARPSSGLSSGLSVKTDISSEGPEIRYDEDGEEIIFMGNQDDTADVFEQDIDMLYLRKHVTQEFLDVFNLGVDTYLKGEWPEARKHLEVANEMMKEVKTLEGYLKGDGPCLTLLEYMEERNWTAPADWKGFRPLTSK